MFGRTAISGLLVLIFLISGCLTSCSRKVRLSYTGASLFSKPLDWQAAQHDPNAYHEQNAEAIEQWVFARKDGQKRTDFSLSTQAGTRPLSIDASRVPEFHRFDKIHLAKAIEVKKGLRMDTASEEGVGIPLVGRIPHTNENPMIPERGLWMPITAALIPGRDQAVIQVIDPTVTPKFPFSSQPAAYDLTAPLALDILDRQKDLQRLKALVNYDKFIPQSGINRLFGFSAQKTPVVLVHGVFSSSTTWNNTINELLADPVIRQEYEFWTYGYPTGAPIPYLSYKLREGVKEMIAYRKQRGAHQQVVVLGHSMGGLMSKTLTQHTGKKIWDQLFLVKPESLPVSAERRKLWRNQFIFEPIPEINRIVFTATPHSGAIGASTTPGKLAEKAIRLPKVIKLAANDLVTNHSEHLTPLGKQLFSDFPNSMGHMRIGSEIGNLFKTIPLNSSNQYHSVIGSKKGLDIPKEEITDGIVNYTNASIPGVASEKVFHSNHGVHANVKSIDEMIRILKLNLQ